MSEAQPGMLSGQQASFANQAIPPFVQYDGPSVDQNRWLNIWSIGIPFAGSLIALGSLPTLGITKTTLCLLAVFLVVNGFGVTIGLHRLFTHHAFKAGKLCHLVLAILGTFAFQGPIDRWVADHRRHHRHSDQPWDIHSPYWRQGRALSLSEGLWHAHVGWMLAGHTSAKCRYAPDIHEGTIAGWASRHYFLLCAVGVLLPGAVGWAIAGLDEALRGLLWAGFMRVSILHQLTWSVNSICHRFGSKEPGTSDESRNNIVLTYVILGEGLHSRHHKYPTAGVKGPLWQDWSGAILVALQRFGIVWSLRRVPDPLQPTPAPLKPSSDTPPPSP